MTNEIPAGASPNSERDMDGTPSNPSNNAWSHATVSAMPALSLFENLFTIDRETRTPQPLEGVIPRCRLRSQG